MKMIRNLSEDLVAKAQGILCLVMTISLWISPFLPWNSVYVEEWSKTAWMLEGCVLGGLTVLVVVLNLIVWCGLDIVARKTESKT